MSYFSEASRSVSDLGERGAVLIALWGGIVGGSVDISYCHFNYFGLSIDLGSILRLREEYRIRELG